METHQPHLVLVLSVVVEVHLQRMLVLRHAYRPHLTVMLQRVDQVVALDILHMDLLLLAQVDKEILEAMTQENQE